MRRSLIGMITAAALVLAACTASGQSSGSSSGSAPSTTSGAAPLPAPIKAILDKPAYAAADWSLLAVDLNTGATLAALDPDRLAFTGSTRKLFSIGVALNTLGAGYTTTTAIYRDGTVDGAGVLHGNLYLVGGGDLTFGGRRTADGTLQFTDFDHNDANSLGTSTLTPQDPLTGVQALADQVKAAGLSRIDGDVVVDDRLFEPYRVPNQQLLITGSMLNENMVDVTITPTTPGQPARIEYRPQTPGFTVTGTVMTTAAGVEPTVAIPAGTTPAGTSVTGVVNCVGQPGCAGTVTGTIPVDYKAPLSGKGEFVGTFRIENPENFVRGALIQALQHSGITVPAPAVGANPTKLLPASTQYPTANRVAGYVSLPYAQQVRLILKVSLNLGANLALIQFGLTKGQRTVEGALTAERSALTGMGISPESFDFPTNGSGSPDSKASPRAIVNMLTAMNKTPVAEVYRTALPLLGVDGSLASTGADLAGKGHVYGKTGTTVTDGKLVAQNLAGYVEAENGHLIAYAIFVNNYGTLGAWTTC